METQRKDKPTEEEEEEINKYLNGLFVQSQEQLAKTSWEVLLGKRDKP